MNLTGTTGRHAGWDRSFRWNLNHLPRPSIPSLRPLTTPLPVSINAPVFLESTLTNRHTISSCLCRPFTTSLVPADFGMHGISGIRKERKARIMYVGVYIWSFSRNIQPYQYVENIVIEDLMLIKNISVSKREITCNTWDNVIILSIINYIHTYYY